MCEWLTLRLIWTLFSLFSPHLGFGFVFFLSLCLRLSDPKSTTFLFFSTWQVKRGRNTLGEQALFCVDGLCGRVTLLQGRLRCL